MDDSQREESLAENAASRAPLETTGDDVPLTSGMEINLGDFTRTQGLMKSLRLTLNNQIVIPVEEIATGVCEAGRKFKMGDLEQANIEIARWYASFGQKVSQWESQARSLEHQMRTQAAKNPKSISIDKMNRMKSEQIAVRTRIRTAEVQFRRLHQGLDQAFTVLQRQPVAATAKTRTALPVGFLAPFQVATADGRPAIVREHFDVNAVLKVTVTRGAKGGYDISFDPVPPLDRLYFLTRTAEIILLRQLGTSVVTEDVETGQTSEMKLVEFVKHVQHGVWMLSPRSVG